MTTIQLQGIGTCKAKPAKEFTVGETAIWNYGYESQILGIEPRGTTQVVWTLGERNGQVSKRTMAASRLVGVIA